MMQTQASFFACRRSRRRGAIDVHCGVALGAALTFRESRMERMDGRTWRRSLLLRLALLLLLLLLLL